MTTTEAKATLNALLSQVSAGETITITSHGRPVAVLSQGPARARRFDQLAGLVTIPDDFDAPMSAEDLALWGEDV